MSADRPCSRVAQLVDHHPPVELVKPLWNVVGGDGEAHAWRRGVSSPDVNVVRRERPSAARRGRL
jgi:hypothetical protein